VGELQALTDDYPLRERLWGLRMLALYRAGRQADALSAYQQARAILSEQLGIDPSRSLQRLHERILAQDPALSVASRRALIAQRAPSGPGELAPGARFGPYRIRAMLGRGGMSVVYLAEHEGLKRNVALKVLAPQLADDARFRERFVRESQLAASLDHPNVIPIYEAGESEGGLFISMRYVDGIDLRQLLKDEQRLEPDRAFAILSQVADALDAAHVRGLVHRDVKPGNILIARVEGAEAREHAYLSDFGLTKRATSLSGITGTGQFIGTLDYAAPEQFQSKTLDARTDTYALGAVLYECLGGEPPFRRETDAALMYAHLSEPPTPLTDLRPGLPGAIDAVVARALAKEPADRFQTGAALIAAAREAFAEAEEETRLRTFLIADVRGYTAYTREHGDDKAAELAASFAQITRETVVQRGGELLELRGDEALVVFESSRQAIRAAIELQDRYRETELPRPVGIGLDAGEAVPVEGGYRGDALNLAARICGQAGPGQVLVSQTVSHLASTLEGVNYVPRSVRLKGYDEPVRVMEVSTSETAAPTGAVARFRRRLKTHPRASVVAALSVVTVLALVATTLPRVFSGGDGTGSASLRPGIALLDAESLEPVAQLPVLEPVEGYFAEGAFWFLNLEPLSFVRIDPGTLRITKTISSPLFNISSFAVDSNSVWEADHDHPILVRIDIATGREVDRIDLRHQGFPDGGLSGPVVGAGSVWVAKGEELLRIDPASGELVSRIPVGDRIASEYLGYGEGTVFVPVGWDRLALVDSNTETVTTSVPLYPHVKFTAGGGGFAWATSADGDQVFKVATNGGLERSFRTGRGPESITYGEGRVWVANFDSGSLGIIDPATGETDSLDVGRSVQGVAVGAGHVAITVGGRSAEAVLAALKGSVLRLAATESYDGQIDPALADEPGMWQVERATCAKLLNYPDVEAPEGWELQPEIAVTMPEVTNGGRTYLFKIRPGYTFSPPSNQPITAETFRFSIERALSPELGRTPGAKYLSDVVGVDDFRAGRAAGITGISARGEELSITIERPSADFLQRLALPYFCPVPDGTPVIEGGLGSVPIPSAGPYYISDNEPFELMILKQNPNYDFGRPSAYDAIALRFGLDIAAFFENRAAVSSNASCSLGNWDGVVGFSYELWSCSSVGENVTEIDLDGTSFVMFNANGPAFSDPVVRRAASLAIDRYSLSRYWITSPTDEVLPPYLPGADQDPQATLPDLEEARRILGDRRPVVTLAAPPWCRADPEAHPFDRWIDCPIEGEILTDLKEIGIQVKLAIVTAKEFRTDPERFDLVNTVMILNYPDSGTFITFLIAGVGGAAQYAPPPSWFPPEIHKEAERIEGMRGTRRTDAAVALARRLAAEAFVMPWGARAIRDLLSESVGCRVYPPYGYGLDLAAACPAG
jgi:class 3 adenylate cyclase/ABC-type transport system substrate-binding protein/tRNA A-37 threonylcarbamoyl transferase component Bud32